MTTYTATNGAIIANLTALRAIPSTDLPASGFVVLFVAAENGWYEYNSSLTSGDVTPTDSPATGRWIRIGRDKVQANRTYYVRTDGSDSNNGLANTSGGAFLTIQKAINVASSLDLNGYIITIQVGNGTYTQALTFKSFIGDGTISIIGDTTTPANVTITSSTSPTILSTTQSLYEVRGFTINCADAVFKIAISSENGNIKFGNIIFPSFSTIGYHLNANGNAAKIEAMANYTISGAADIHALSNNGAFITVRSRTITISGTPAFATSFVRATVTGMIDFVSNTYSGSATGTRYTAALNGVVFANGATLPGNVGGTVATGGQFQ